MNDDDFDDDIESDISDEPSFDDFGSENTIGDLWRNNPFVKIGTIVGGGILIFATIIMLSGEKEKAGPSLVTPPPDVSGTPGTEEVSETYKALILQQDQENVEQAIKSGGSALPTPIDPPKGQITSQVDREDEDDPLVRWKRLQEERLQNQAQQNQILQEQTAGQAPENTARNEAIQALAEAMAQQMQSVLENQGSRKVDSMQITDPSIFDETGDGSADSGTSENEGGDGSSQDTADGAEGEGPQPGDIIQTVLLPAGEIEYAQLITEANSDAPGPVLAQIASGPLAGSRVLGDFEVQEELLTLSFHTVVVDGVSMPVDAVGLDPDTTLPGMATEVDRRIFQRVILPMAANFVEGAAEAISESGRLTVTVEGETVTEETQSADSRQEIASGIDEAGAELSDILEEMGGSIKVLVKIESGTPLGILFLEPVIQESSI